MTNSLISIIIPVFNHAHTLMRSFESINSQTYRPFEIIVVNDGSSDGFGSVMDRVKLRFYNLNIKVINQQNAGASVARNRGFAESIGELVIFWDADTIANAKMLEYLKAELDAHPKSSYAYSQFKFGWKKFGCRPFDAAALRKNNYIDTTSLIKRSHLPKKPFDESLKRFQDWDLWLTFLEQNKIGTFVPKVLFKKIVGNRKGISNWIPRFAFLFPSRRVSEYKEAKEVVLRKHRIV